MAIVVEKSESDETKNTKNLCSTGRAYSFSDVNRHGVKGSFSLGFLSIVHTTSLCTGTGR